LTVSVNVFHFKRAHVWKITFSMNTEISCDWFFIITKQKLISLNQRSRYILSFGSRFTERLTI